MKKASQLFLFSHACSSHLIVGLVIMCHYDMFPVMAVLAFYRGAPLECNKDKKGELVVPISVRFGALSNYVPYPMCHTYPFTIFARITNI